MKKKRKKKRNLANKHLAKLFSYTQQEEFNVCPAKKKHDIMQTFLNPDA